MEIINKPMVKLNIDEIDALRRLNKIKMDIDNDKIFLCEGNMDINCFKCPFTMDNKCAIGELYDTITFIDSVTTEG